MYSYRSDDSKKTHKESSLNLRAGEIVEVRREKEISATLDENGTFEGLPFMPEMQKYCGKKFKVLKSVKKVIVEGIGMRSLKDTVILKGVTCDGEAHRGCRRTCLVFWKHCWLRRVERNSKGNQVAKEISRKDYSNSASALTFETRECQSVYLRKATLPLPKWDIRLYLWELTSRTHGPVQGIGTIMTSLNLKIRGLLGYPMLYGELVRTPSVSLDLQPGDRVKVKSKEEILATLDSKGRNRGLEFTPEMIKYCGKEFEVLRRLDKMINEITGEMRQIANTVIIRGATCDGNAHGGCQRTCYCLWREIWLQKIE